MRQNKLLAKTLTGRAIEKLIAVGRGIFGGRRPDPGRRLEDLLDQVLPPARLDAGLTRVMLPAACLKDHAPVRLTSPATYDWTGEDWYFRQAVRATEIVFVRGRLRFERPDGTRGAPAPVPSVLLYFRGHDGTRS